MILYVKSDHKKGCDDIIDICVIHVLSIHFERHGSRICVPTLQGDAIHYLEVQDTL